MDIFVSQGSNGRYDPLDNSVEYPNIRTEATIPNYSQIGSVLNWPQSGSIDPFIAPSNSLAVTCESSKRGDFSLPVGSPATLAVFETPMAASAPSYVTLERSTLLISNVVQVPARSNVLANSLQLIDLNLNNRLAVDLEVVPGNHSWVTGINVIRPISTLNPPWSSSWAVRGSNISLSLRRSTFDCDFADGDRFTPTLFDPVFDEIACETLDIWGRRMIFRRIVYRLTLLRRSALNLKALVDRCIKNFEHRLSRKPVPGRSKKSYKTHPRVTINLPLMC